MSGLESQVQWIATAYSPTVRGACKAFHYEENKHHMQAKGILKTCDQGHRFYKSSDCPTCPICEEIRKPKDNFLSLLVAPARRALENQGITKLDQLAQYTEKEILSLHGMGKSTIPKLQKLLADHQLTFKQ